MLLNWRVSKANKNCVSIGKTVFLFKQRNKTNIYIYIKTITNNYTLCLLGKPRDKLSNIAQCLLECQTDLLRAKGFIKPYILSRFLISFQSISMIMMVIMTPKFRPKAPKRPYREVLRILNNILLTISLHSVFKASPFKRWELGS